MKCLLNAQMMAYVCGGGTGWKGVAALWHCVVGLWESSKYLTAKGRARKGDC